MKKLNEQQGLVVENEMIEFANLGDELVITAVDRLIVLTKAKMTATDMVKTIEMLTKITQNLLEALAKNYKEMDTDSIKLPDYILAIAGIPKDAKLIAYAEEDSGIVHVEQEE